MQTALRYTFSCDFDLIKKFLIFIIIINVVRKIFAKFNALFPFSAIKSQKMMMGLRVLCGPGPQLPVVITHFVNSRCRNHTLCQQSHPHIGGGGGTEAICPGF